MVPIPHDRTREPRLEPPNPFRAGSSFLQWLSKHHRRAMRSECEEKWALHKKNNSTPELDDCSLNDFIKYITSVDPDLIQTGPDPRFGEIVKITKKGVDWAAEWAIAYRNPRGHHGEKSRQLFE